MCEGEGGGGEVGGRFSVSTTPTQGFSLLSTLLGGVGHGYYCCRPLPGLVGMGRCFLSLSYKLNCIYV